MIPAIAGALNASRRSGFRVIHLSIQHNHVHLIIEADDGNTRSKGMQYFSSQLAKAINKACERTGTVFQHRYHATPIETPTQMLRTLTYVLCNWRHHGEHLASPAASAATFDPYSSALRFAGWTEPAIAVYDPQLPVDDPATWMAREGWKLVGRIDPFVTPGKSRSADGVRFTLPDSTASKEAHWLRRAPTRST